MKLRRVRITENSEQDTAEFVILPGFREQARRGRNIFKGSGYRIFLPPRKEDGGI